MKDLTTGAPGRVLVRYTLPLFGSIIFQQLYNIADSFVAGRYIGTEALAAVGNSYEITLIYIAIAFGLNIGTSVVTATFFGEKRLDAVKTSVHTALTFCAALGLVMTVAGMLASGWLLQIINTPAEVFADSQAYLNIYLIGYLFLIIYNVSTGVFSALGDSRTPFLFLAVSSVTNIFMDVLLVVVFHMGVPGVAWATCLCQGVSGVAALMAVLVKVRPLTTSRGLHFSFPTLGRIMRIAVPSMLQQSFISIGNIIIQSVINGFGTAAIGGYAAAIKLNNMTITSITAVGSGMSNYTAQNLGAGKHARIVSGLKWGIGLACGIALFFTGAYLLFGAQLVGLFINDGNLAAAGVGEMFLSIVSPFYIMVAGKLIFDGVLRGAGQMSAFMLSTMVDLVLRVVLSILLAAPMGTNGVWSSWPIGWGIAVVMSGVLCVRWLKRDGERTNALDAKAMTEK